MKQKIRSQREKRPYHSLRRQRQAEETGQRILAAARKLLASKGYARMTVEEIAASTVFIPFAFACIVLGAKFVGTRGWRAYGVYSLIFGLVSLIYPIGIVAYLFNPTAFGNVNSPNDGLINRSVLLLGPLTWYVITAVLALQHTGRTSDRV